MNKEQFHRKIYRLIICSNIVNWFVSLKLTRLLAFLATKFGFYKNVNSGYTVLCLGRPIFNDDIDALALYSGKINYFIIPKEFWINIFKCFLTPLLYEHINYHRIAHYEKKKHQYRKFLSDFFGRLQKMVRFDAILSANYVYSWQQEIAAFCVENNFPFMVLHKEGITAKSNYFGLVGRYTNNHFVGTKMLVYNENIRDALLSYGVSGMDESIITAVGVPRFDRYFDCKGSGDDVVFFSFFIEDKLGHLGLHDDQRELVINLSEKFHAEVMRFAANNPDIHVVIKTKKNIKYLYYVKHIFMKYGYTLLPNLTITNSGNPYELIKKSSVIIAYNSGVLIEGVIADRVIITPDFGSVMADHYFANHQEIVNFVRTSQEIEEVVSGKCRKKYSAGIKKDFLENFIYKPDGKASARTEYAILNCLHNSHCNNIS